MASKLRVDSILPVDGAPTSGGGGVIQVVSATKTDTQTLIDVTDTSQVKVKFRVYSNGSVSVDVSSAENRNCATFTRIGDT